MTKWIERYRRQAEERFSRLDELLAELADDENEDQEPNERRGAAS